MNPVMRTQSVHSLGGQEDISITDTQHQQSQNTAPSPPWNLIPAKLAHGSLMLAALALGTGSGDSGGNHLL